jgi:hypothetical protein
MAPSQTPSLTQTHTSTATLTQPPTDTSTATRTETPESTTTATSQAGIPGLQSAEDDASPTPRPTRQDGAGGTPQVGNADAATGTLIALVGTDLFVTPAFVGGTPLAFNSPTPLPTIPPIGQASSPSFSIPGFGDLLIPNENGVITSASGQSFNAAGSIFDAAPNGQFAYYGYDDQLYINGQLLTVGPAGLGGLPAEVRVDDLQWATDGRFLTIVTSANPPLNDAGGVWVYDTATGTANQILRSSDMIAEQVRWSPDGNVVLVSLTTTVGEQRFALIPRTAEVGFYWWHDYQDASWAQNGLSVIASGLHLGNPASLVRIDVVDQNQVTSLADVSSAGISVTRAATELADGQIAFLGASSASGPYRLYTVFPDGVPAPISGEINGSIRDWAWNAERKTLLVTTSLDQLWVVRSDGTITNATPPGGAPDYVSWR